MDMGAYRGGFFKDDRVKILSGRSPVKVRDLYSSRV